MRIVTLSMRVVAAVVLTTVTQAYSAGPNQPAHSVGRTAVIDLSHIFEQSTYVTGEVAKIRREADATAEQFKKLEAQLRKSAESLKDYKQGSPEYARLEAQLVQRKADLRVQAQLKQKQLAEQQSKVYFAAYEQVEKLVRLYSMNNGISLVLRSNQKEAKAPQTAAERMRRIQRPVVFEQNVDITLPILEELNRRSGLSLKTSRQ